MLEIRTLVFQHHAATVPAIKDVTIAVEPGMFVAVVGPSGSGKSTLLRAMNGLIPHFYGGRIGGSVLVNGIDTRQVSTAELSQHIGFVSQEPEGQTVFDTVVDEIAFGPENLGFSRDEIHQRVHETMRTLQVEHLQDRDLSTLSGGERQRVVIAATLAMGSRLLVLDEPLSQLDPWAAGELLHTLQRLNREHGVAIIITEHRIDSLLRHCTHVLELSHGRASAGMQELQTALPTLTNRPSLIQIADLLGWHEFPLSVSEAQALHIVHGPQLPAKIAQNTGEKHDLLSILELSVRSGESQILKEISLEIPEGSITALMGPNGSGKSTLLRAIAGLQTADFKQLTLGGEPISEMSTIQRARLIGYVPQYPAALFLGQSVYEEIEIALGDAADTASILHVLNQFELEHLAPRYSWDISGGERQRLAIAIAVARRPRILLLDEPTRGMDQQARSKLKSLIRQLAYDGTAVLLSTHDSELTAACADTAVLLNSGELAFHSSTQEALANDPVLLTDVAATLGTDYLTVESVASALIDSTPHIDHSR